LLYFSPTWDRWGIALHRTVLLSLIPALALLVSGRAAADASLFIYPTLVMFEGNAVSAEVTIANRGDESGTFEIDWANMEMTAEGGLVRHDEAVPWSIQPFVRYSPRRVTLEPSQSQVIKIALRRDDSIPEGEYYSHMRVLTLNSEPVDAAAAGPEPEPGVSITARSAIAIPVVWRNSRAQPAATIESATVDAEGHNVMVDVTRHGPLSVRGFVHLIAGSNSGETYVLSDPTPLVLYPTVDRRRLSIALPGNAAVAGLPADAELVYSPDEALTPQSTIYSRRSISTDR